MVVLTQSQQEAIWEHLLTTVLQQPKDNDYWMVLKTAGITNVTDFIADQDDIDDVKKWYYDKPIVDADGNPVKDNAGQPTYSQYTMKRYEANMTFIAKDYVWKTAIDLGYSSTSDMKHTDYMKLDKEGYDRMRTDPNYKMRRDRITSGSNANPANPGNPNPQTTNKSAVDQFQKSIKRDQSAFPTLKNDDHFDTWNRGTIIQAKIQDVADVLSANYTPITAEDKALFQLKQQFMYGVFERTLTTDKGKSIVRKYQDDVDAQKVYQDTKKHYTDSVKARFDSSKYLRYITTAKYDQSWTGTSQAFIIHWQEQARLYNSLVPASQKYKNNALLVLLQTAVDQCPELRSVYNMAQQLEASSGNVLDYDKYVTTLLSACVQLDSTLGPKKPIKTQRGIYHAQYDHHDNVSSDTLEPDLPPLGIDTPISDIEAYFVRRRGPNSSMTKNQWDRLSSDGQTIWDTMTNEDKAIILEPRPAIKPQPQLTGPPNLATKLQDSNYQRNLNLSNISAAEYLQMMHEHSGDSTRQSQDPTPAFTPPNNDATDSTSLLTFLSDRLSQDKNDKQHPAHLQRMMSSSQASKTSKEPGKPEVKSISWMGRTYTANAVDVTNKTQYSVRKVSRLKDRALVDRGANGGVAGDDVYVISRDPIRKVDITGVENHQVKDIYIGSVAGMVQSTKGPVIAVMHQHEKVYIIAGPEFGDRQGETLIIYKALYGLRSSGLQWHKRFAAVLRKEGFVPCKMEPDMWLRERNGVYEYIAVYVDDLAFAMHEPQKFADRLIDEYKFKLKGTGKIEYHLGCDFTRDTDGTLCMHPKKYIQRMVDGYVRMFGEKPNSRVRSPLEENDHPEVDESDFLDADGIAKYQSLVGSMQWAISLGRVDISTACMTLSGFRSCPRIGHLDRAKRIVGYLSRMSEAAIRFRTKVPDYSDLPGFEYDWDTSIYGNIREDTPDDAPKPLGNPVLLTHYIDANLYHDLLTGRSVTGILHFFNQTPIDWYSKKQGKVETATYGSEFMAARTAVEKIMDLRTTLRYLGVPIIGKSYMFGDNEAVVNSAAKIDSKLHKRHNALSFHRVREAIASRMVDFYHIPGKQNPADILSKHWAYGKVWQLLRPLLFWMGDTNNIPE